MKKYFKIGLPVEIIAEIRRRLAWQQLPESTPDVEIVDRFLGLLFLEIDYDEFISTEELHE